MRSVKRLLVVLAVYAMFAATWRIIPKPRVSRLEPLPGWKPRTARERILERLDAAISAKTPPEPTEEKASEPGRSVDAEPQASHSWQRSTSAMLEQAKADSGQPYSAARQERVIKMVEASRNSRGWERGLVVARSVESGLTDEIEGFIWRKKLGRIGQRMMFASAGQLVTTDLDILFNLELVCLKRDAGGCAAASPAEFREKVIALGLMEPGDWPSNAKGEYVDPWGRPYQFVLDHKNFGVYSFGLNGRDERGLGDDVLVGTAP